MSKLATSLKFVDAQPEHAEQIIADLSEHAVWDGARSVSQLQREIGASLFTHVAVFNGRAAAVWGVQQHSLIENDGYLWLVSTKAVEDNPFLFIRYGRIVLDSIAQHFNYLHCTLKSGEQVSAKWLRLLKFEERPAVIIDGTTYVRFYRGRA